jgi:hypothetical protein
MEQINMLFLKNAQSFSVKAGGTYTCHDGLKG